MYGAPACLDKRRKRDRCIADHLLVWYERETDTLLLRPILPLDEMTRYAVVVTDRMHDGKGNAVKSPFDFVYHASMASTAQRVLDVLNDRKLAAYWGDLAGTGLDHVAFTWSYTTQPTVADLKALRDGLYGQGPFGRWAKQYPPRLELNRTVGLVSGLLHGDNKDPADWKTSTDATAAGCAKKIGNLHVVKYADIRDQMKILLTQGFGFPEGPGSELLLSTFENIDHMVVGTFKSPFLVEGGPKGTDPNASFNLNYTTGQGEETEDTVELWLAVPRETAKFKQPFNVDIYGHGYTGNFSEMLLYAGNMAQHGVATVGINAVGHGLYIGDTFAQGIASNLLAQACVGPFYDAITQSRARDLNNDGVPDSGGDFWSSYLFHTRDGVRQSVLDHIQLVRILRAFGSAEGQMLCRNDKTGWDKPATEPCDVNGDGKPEVAGDFDGDGQADVGGAKATFGTWGESLGGILRHPRRHRRQRHRGRARLGRRRPHRHRRALVPGRRRRGGAPAPLGSAPGHGARQRARRLQPHVQGVRPLHLLRGHRALVALGDAGSQLHRRAGDRLLHQGTARQHHRLRQQSRQRRAQVRLRQRRRPRPPRPACVDRRPRAPRLLRRQGSGQELR